MAQKTPLMQVIEILGGIDPADYLLNEQQQRQIDAVMFASDNDPAVRITMPVDDIVTLATHLEQDAAIVRMLSRNLQVIQPHMRGDDETGGIL